MARQDLRKREELAAIGALFDGYHPAMEAIHSANAEALEEIIRNSGGLWPSPDIAGAQAAEAAWLIVQHAIGLPDFQRRMLVLLQAGAAAGHAPAWQAAYLEDRIRTLEGKPQIYGTQFDWDDHGELSPLPIENPQDVNKRRCAAGLEPIEEKTAALRRTAQAEGNRPPQDIVKRRKDADAWARKAGWR